MRSLVVLLTVTTACTGATADSGEVDVDRLPFITLEEELRLGSVEDPEAGFSAIGAVTVDPDGNLYVFEMQDMEIRVFAPDGTRLRTFGRQGEGPGEFQMYPSYMGVQGDTLWTIGQSSRARIVLFTRDGEHLSTSGPLQGVRVAVQSESMEGIARPRSMLPDGRFISDMTGFSGRRDPGPPTVQLDDTVMVPRVLFDAMGGVLDTVGFDVRPPPPPPAPTERIEIDGQQFNVPRAQRDEPLTFALDDGRVYIERPTPVSGDPALFTVTRLDLARDTIFHRRFQYTPKEYTQAVIDTLVARSVRIPGGAYRIVNGQPIYPEPPSNPDAVAARLREAMSFPSHQPPIQGYWPGNNGWIWLEREDMGGPEREYVVLDADGQPLGRIIVPRNTTIAWSDATTLLVRERDELDVQWLVKYRIDR